MATPTVSNGIIIANLTTHAARAHSSFANGGQLLNSPISYLLAQLLVIIILSRLLGYLLAKIKEPMVVAEMIVGICLGPTVLGRIPGWEEALFPSDSIKAMKVVADLGLVLFMFVIGLELDTNYIKSRGWHAVAASLLSLVAPVLVAIPLMEILHKPKYVPTANEFTFYLFLAVVISISALPVLARILSEYRLLSTPLGAFTINCTTVDDVISWPVLSLALALNGSSNWRGVVYTILLALGHCALAVLLLRPVLRYVVARAVRQSQLSHFYLFLITLVMLLNAWLVEIIGLSALIGAMEIGILMPRNNHLVGQLSSRIEDLVVVVFLPLFFTVSGLRTQLASIDSLELWGLTALITVATCLSKIFGSLPPARFIGKLSWRDSIAFGCLMNTKGLVALVAINLGLSEGLITDKLFSMLVVMVLFNTFLTCPLVWLVFRLAPRAAVTESIAFNSGAAAAANDSSARNNTTVMIAPQSVQIAPLLTVLGSSFYPTMATKGKLHVLRLVPVADRPSYYMGDYKKKAISRDEVIRAVVARAAISRIPLEVLCEVSNDVLSDSAQLVEQSKIDIFLVDYDIDEFYSTQRHHLLARMPCSVGLVLMPTHITAPRVAPRPQSADVREPLELQQRRRRRRRSSVSLYNSRPSRWQRLYRCVLHVLQGGLLSTPPDGVQGLGADLKSLLFVYTGGPHDDNALAHVVTISRTRNIELVVLQMVQTVRVTSACRESGAASATVLLGPEMHEGTSAMSHSAASSGISGSVVVDHLRMLAKNNDLLQQVYADSQVRFRSKDFVEDIAPAILEELQSSDFSMLLLGFGSRFRWQQYLDEIFVPLCVIHSPGSCSPNDVNTHHDNHLHSEHASPPV